jgi:hypothetical protein
MAELSEIKDKDTGVVYGIKDANARAAIEELKQNGTGGNVDPAVYGLPVLNLTGDTTSMSKDNAVSLSYVYGERSGTASVKWQGSSSLSYPKKNYTITFDNAFEAKSGWGSHDKYCLKANWVDASQMRNIFCAKLWGLMVKSRANVDPRLSALPNGGAIDGFPVIVVFNGEPAGLYTMNIPKDGWMFGMTGVNANEAIMCAEASGFYNPVVGDETDFEVEYTGADTDESKAAAIKSLNNLVTVCNSVASADDLPALEALVDIQSLVDYYILSAVICHRDGITKNYILATYDGVKWFISAYDMDATFGNKWDGSGFYWYNDYPTFANLCDNNKLMWIVRTYYLADLKARWAQLKSWDIGQGNFTAEVTNLAHQFPVKAYMLDWNLWSTVPGTNANNTEQIKDYHWLRMPMIDWELSQLT